MDPDPDFGPVLRSRSFFDRLLLQVGTFFSPAPAPFHKKSSKKHVFAFTSLHRLRLRNTALDQFGSGSRIRFSILKEKFKEILVKNNFL